MSIKVENPEKIVLLGKQLSKGEMKRVPQGVYDAQVVAGDFVKDAQENQGFFWIFRVLSPKRHKGLIQLKLTPLDKIDDFVQVSRDLTFCGLTVGEIYDGPVGSLVAGRLVRISVEHKGKNDIVRLFPPITDFPLTNMSPSTTMK